MTHAGGRAGAQPYTAGNLVTTVHQRGALETECNADGIRIEWSYHTGGPAMNAALVSGLVDFAYHGIGGATPGRDAGIGRKFLLRVGQNGNTFTYVVVRADSPFRSLADLRGKRFGTILGAGGHVTLCRMLEKAGIGVRDVTFVNLDSAATKTRGVLE